MWTCHRTLSRVGRVHTVQPSCERSGATLDERWPLLADDEALHWLRRCDAGRSPYSRVRVIRAQLDAVIALALQLALRRAEIHALDVNTAAFDNTYVMSATGTMMTTERSRLPRLRADRCVAGATRVHG